MQVKLRGLSQKGKQRIRDWGEDWEIKEIRSGLVQSTKDSKGESLRWVDQDDRDMVVYE